MKILIRTDDKSKTWKFAESVKAKAEAELQRLLIESPSLIPIDEIREGVSPLVLAISEFGLPGSGNTDIIAFSPDGDIAIIECKLAANPEAKRKVIGQILEYAAYLWRISFDELNNRVQRIRGRSLVELVQESTEGEWNEEAFLTGVRQSLTKGSFILVVVVDEINEELRRTIRYVNECSKSAFSLHALEMRRFRIGEIEILVPHLYGTSAKPLAEEAKRKKWSEEEFLRVLKESVEADMFQIIRDLYIWSKNVADKVRFGTGVETGSFTFLYFKDGKAISVFTIYTNGKLMLNYGMLLTQLEHKVLESFHKKIQEIPVFKRIPADFSKWPTVEITGAFKGDIDKFKQIIRWLGKEIKSRQKLLGKIATGCTIVLSAQISSLWSHEILGDHFIGEQK